jgi:hypothetical protein
MWAGVPFIARTRFRLPSRYGAILGTARNKNRTFVFQENDNEAMPVPGTWIRVPTLAETRMMSHSTSPFLLQSRDHRRVTSKTSREQRRALLRFEIAHWRSRSPEPRQAAAMVPIRGKCQGVLGSFGR